MTKLYLIRHGKTDWNIKHLFQGSNDIELNEEGIKSAELIANEIDLSNIDVCISSPQKRALKTAQIICKDRDIILDNRLKERRGGDYEGTEVSYEVIDLFWDYKLNYSEKNIENIKDTLKRAKEFLDYIKSEYKDKNILVISHAAIMKALHYNIIGYDENTDFQSFFPENTKIYEYDI